MSFTEETAPVYKAVQPIFQTATAPGKPTKKRKRPSPITLRMNAEERAKLEELAQGMTLSAYIRMCALQNEVPPQKRTSRSPVENEEALAQILGLLGQSRIANNLNQLAKAANTGSLLLDDETEREINEAYQYVVEIRGLLIKSLGLKETIK